MRSSGTPGRRRWLRVLRGVTEVGVALVAIAALILWCSIPNTAPLATENPTSTAFIDLRRAEAEARGEPFHLRWQWRPLGKLSRYLRASVVYAEDHRFYRHHGVDWTAVEQAFDANWRSGSLSVGGSSITQQLAKNLYLSPSRSFTRKLRELLIAYSLEEHLTKQRILELYLNIAEWGPGVFGAEAAAQHWFGHSAQQMTPGEAVRLVCMLPGPLTSRPNALDWHQRHKAVRLIRMLRMQGLIDKAQERAALDDVGAGGQAVLP